jgi:hypothetical protein
MTNMNIEEQKALVVEQFKQVNDIKLINAIKSILDYALQKDTDVYNIPEEHQDIVMERFDKVRNEPDILLDWDEAKKMLKYE